MSLNISFSLFENVVFASLLSMVFGYCFATEIILARECDFERNKERKESSQRFFNLLSNANIQEAHLKEI